MLIDALFIVAVACGCIGALRGNGAAVALLCATALTSALTAGGVPFHPALWALVDIGVVMAIMRPNMSNGDIAIVALYVPIWALYPVEGWTAYYIISALAALQFLLTFPAPEIFAKTRRVFGKCRRDTDGFEMTWGGG